MFIVSTALILGKKFFTSYLKKAGMLDAILLLSVIFIVWKGWGMLSADSAEYATSFLISKLFVVVMFIGVLRVSLHAFDKLIDFNYAEWFAELDDRSKAIIMATRLAALSLALAMLLSQ